jgi:hypothetical protein
LSGRARATSHVFDELPQGPGGKLAERAIERAGRRKHQAELSSTDSLRLVDETGVPARGKFRPPFVA